MVMYLMTSRVGLVTWFLLASSCCHGDVTSCFPHLRGEVEECYCSVEDVEATHEANHEALAALVKRDYFRYYDVDLSRKCRLWDDVTECTRGTCALKMCGEGEVPAGLQSASSSSPSSSTCEEEAQLSRISNEISAAQLATLEQQHGSLDFCLTDGSENAVFYDLLQNPERYTGYSGEASRRIWRSIYEENCFKPDSYLLDVTHHSINLMCKEKRVFFRAVSGLHASISVHLAAKFPTEDFYGTTWGPNLAEFLRRFMPGSTGGEGPYWLKNLYFVYLLEMRAVTKALPLWRAMEFQSGNLAQDTTTKQSVLNTVEGFLSCPDTFDERELFQGPDADLLLEQTLLHFRNISRIMDCVTCDKCRLWGKIQTRGLGTALKILFSGPALSLQRGEVVTLFNAFSQLSASLHYVRRFKEDDTSTHMGKQRRGLFSTVNHGEL